MHIPLLEIEKSGELCPAFQVSLFPSLSNARNRKGEFETAHLTSFFTLNSVVHYLAIPKISNMEMLESRMIPSLDGSRRRARLDLWLPLWLPRAFSNASCQSLVKDQIERTWKRAF
jgi:hypothetical protein